MQLMPDTAARYGVTNPYDVAQSIMGGTRYLKDLLTMFNGRVDLALAGYNAGEGAVMKYGNTIPPYSETRNYVKLILARYGRKQTS
jgi:soluble lytic murein transglycosylase-like protein